MGRVPITDDNMAGCLCHECPSEPHGEPALYCAEGKSPQHVRRRGCACSDCPVWARYGLTGEYYCDEGVTE